MNRIYKFSVVFIILTVTLLGSFRPQRSSLAGQPAQTTGSGRPLHFQEIPSEIRSAFADGMSLDRFLALNDGRLPRALGNAAGQDFISIIIELETEPLSVFYSQTVQTQGFASAAELQAYHTSLVDAQAQVVQGVSPLGGQVIAQYTKSYNGMLVRIPVNQVEALLNLPGVIEIHPAPRFQVSLSHSVPLIQAEQVFDELGIDGTGITIAVIDTGVDYTHAAFGGSGLPDDFENNDPTVIEPGSFPTAKVIGGFDFAGSDYNPDSPDPAMHIPKPDPDPIDEMGHGTHVASIAAGHGVSDLLSRGVAPGASIYALKIFGQTGSTELVVDAIEWALDPNGDNDLSDRVDVINLSLGSAFSTDDPRDPIAAAVENAADAGVVVVAASGNNGNIAYITSNPGSADSAISVAASTTGWETGPTVTLDDGTQIIYSSGQFEGETGIFGAPITAELVYVGPLFGSDLLCAIPDGAGTPLAGKIALIQRGECTFTDKVNNAAALGASAAIIFDNEEDATTLVVMTGPEVLIPAAFVRHSDGLALSQSGSGRSVTISAEEDVSALIDPINPSDTLGSFSSRGPRTTDASLKPDVTAPGVGIYAAKMGSGDKGIAQNGTSMATPHVAGVAALILSEHPDWSPDQVKAAIMNTAVDLSPGSTSTPLQGTGRVDAYRAVTTDAYAYGDEEQVSLNWGIIELGEESYSDTRTLTLQDLSGDPGAVYEASVVWGDGSLNGGVTIQVSPSSGLAGPAAAAEVSLSIDATQVSDSFTQLEEYYGYILLTNTQDSSAPLRVPFYFIVQPYSQVSFESIDSQRRTVSIEIEHEGPIASSLWVYPLYEEDDNDRRVIDMADLRMVGMDYGFFSDTYGDIFIPAFNTYGSWSTPQPYLVEFDLFFDVTGDGEPDFADFNWNAGRAFGLLDDDVWVVIQVDLNTLEFTLGSPFEIYTDYNSGYMEWGLPAASHGLSEQKTDFNWQARAITPDGRMDSTRMHTFDIANPPFTWTLTNSPGPDQPAATLTVELTSRRNWRLSRPDGLMLVDYNGKAGEGQAYALTSKAVPKIRDLFSQD